jgi:hypothetical protein
MRRSVSAPRVNRRRTTGARAALFTGVALAACASGLRTAPLGPRGANGPPPVLVDSSPPLPKIEHVPPDPGKPCVWLDGRWEWVDQSWSWTPGGWVSGPSGCHYAMPEALWVPAQGRGLLYYLPGRWYHDTDDSACEAARACP